MSDELERAKTRLSHGRLLLEETRHVALPPKRYSAKQSKKLIRDMDLTIAGMEKYLASLRKSPHP